MIKQRVYSSVAVVMLALSAMPAAACPGKGSGFASPTPPQRVAVVATTDGFAIAAKTNIPATQPRATVPLGVQTKIDLAAFECSTRRLASVRP